MLYADKNALRTQLKVQMLRIREKELMYYTNNCLSISTSAALLAGFAWYGLTEVPFEEQACRTHARTAAHARTATEARAQHGHHSVRWFTTTAMSTP
jgi:hypothetical protein